MARKTLYPSNQVDSSKERRRGKSEKRFKPTFIQISCEGQNKFYFPYVSYETRACSMKPARQTLGSGREIDEGIRNEILWFLRFGRGSPRPLEIAKGENRDEEAWEEEPSHDGEYDFFGKAFIQ